jgi:hypothetical protein
MTVTHHPRRHILKYTGPGPNDRVISNGDSRGNIHIGGNPDAFSHGYGLVREPEAGIVIIVTRRTKKAFLRNDRMLPDLYRIDRIEPGIFAYLGMIADLDAPGIMQAGSRTHFYLLADPTAK